MNAAPVIPDPRRELSAREIHERYTRTVTLKDGTFLCIRPLRPDDREREVDFIESLSEYTRYMRLMTPLRYLPPHLLDQFMDVDYEWRMAFVATVGKGNQEKTVGLARYGVTSDPEVVELGVTVTDAWQRRGIATLLMNDLFAYARERGFKRMIALVLPENARMLQLARSHGAHPHLDIAEGVMHAEFPLTTN